MQLLIFSKLSKNTKVYLFLLIFLIGLLLLGEGLVPGFSNPVHLGVILRQASFLGTVSIGQTLVILTGGIDLSVGPIVSLGNIFMCELLGRYGNLTLPILFLVLAVGFGIGACNGLGIIYLRIPPLIMTMAVGAIVEGTTLLYCRGSAAGFATPLLQYLGSAMVLEVFPINFLLWIIITGIAIFFLQGTTYGRKIFAIGTNELAAHASGLNVSSTKILTYGISGLTAAFAGAILAGYTQTGYLGIGNEYILSSIATVVIGGTSIMGGEGGLIGTFIGAIILMVIKSLLTVLKMPEAGRKIVEGVVILILIIVYVKKQVRT